MRKVEYFLMVVVAIFAAIVLPLFYKEHKMDLGTTSDIVIALSNIAMAGTALYAASKAKDWFNEKKLNVAFDQAISTLVEYDKLKVQLDVFHTNLVIDSKKIYGNDLYDRYNDDLKELRHSILAFVRTISNSKRLGFEMKKDIRQQIADSLPLYINLVYKIFALKDASEHMQILNILTKTKESQFAELEALHAETNTLSAMMTKSIDEIFDFKSR